MPHAIIENQSLDDSDEILIQQFLDARTTDDPFGLDRELEPGEKADDAEDYEDISDGDLAEDEDAEEERRSQIEGELHIGASSIDLETFTQDVDFPALVHCVVPANNTYDDDLFGEDLSSPVEIMTGAGQLQSGHDPDGPSELGESSSPKIQPVLIPKSPISRRVEASEMNVQPTSLRSKETPLSRELQRQQELLAMSGNGATNTDALPAPPENGEELLISLWPKFERNTIPKFMDLLPPKRARYLGKPIPKPPKPISPTKINLDLGLDQEKSFKVSSIPYKLNVEESSLQGVIKIQEEFVAEKGNEEDMDIESDFENELVQGIAWQDLQMICEDLDTHSSIESFRSDQDLSCSRKTSHPDAYMGLEHDREPDYEYFSVKVSPN